MFATINFKIFHFLVFYLRIWRLKHKICSDPLFYMNVKHDFQDSMEKDMGWEPLKIGEWNVCLYSVAKQQIFGNEIQNNEIKGFISLCQKTNNQNWEEWSEKYSSSQLVLYL